MLTERGSQIGKLNQMLEITARGRGSTAIISGAIGFGKTALLETVTENAANGFHVLAAVCDRVERQFPYAVIEQLFHGTKVAGGGGVDLPTMIDEETQSIFGRPSWNTVRVLKATHRKLIELSARGPVLISVDDVHNADVQSLQCLLYLIRRCRRIPVATVLTHRPSSGYDHPLLAELACCPGVQHLHLEPLTEEGIGELMQARIGEDTDEGWAAGCLAASGGNPLLANAMVDDQVRNLSLGGGASVPGDLFRRASLGCVHRSSGAAVVAVAAGVAVLERFDSVHLLARLVELEEFQVAAALKVLTDCRLLVDNHFRDPAIRAAVIEGLPDADRTRLHREAARLLVEAGARALLVARHLLEAGSVHYAWMARLLVEAAEQARAEGQIPLAVRCLRLADDRSEDDEQRHLITFALTKIMWQEKPAASGRMLQALAAPARTGAISGVTRLQVARGLLECGWIDDGIDIMKQVGILGDAMDQQLSDELDISRLWLASTFPGAAKMLEASLGVASRTDPRTAPLADAPRMQAEHGLLTALTGTGWDTDARVAERTLQSLPLNDETINSLLAAIMTLAYTDRLQAGIEWCDLLLARIGPGRAPSWITRLRSARAFILLRQGNVLEAIDDALGPIDELSQDAWVIGAATPLAILIEAHTILGQHDSATDLVARPVPGALFQTRYGLHYLFARGRHRLAKWYPDAAMADFLECGEKMQGWALDSPNLVPWRLGVAEVWLRTGEPARAEQVLNEHLALVGQSRSRNHGIALRLLAQTRVSGQRVELLSQSLEILQPIGDRYEIALTLAELGREYQRQGGAHKARLVERQAWHLARDFGASELMTALMPARSGAGAASADRRSDVARASDLLSGAEMRVTSLAAQGYTNREISSKLVITVSTVEQHLTRVYRKLKIRHRRELPACFASLRTIA